MKPRTFNDTAATAVLGTLLMMALLMSMVPAMIAMSNEGKALAEAQTDANRAERERVELAAFCARHPSIGAPECPYNGPMPGYQCERAPASDAWICRDNTPAGVAAGISHDNTTTDEAPDLLWS